MSNNWSSFNAKQKDDVTAVFEALSVLDALAVAVTGVPQDKRITFRDFVGWLKAPLVDLPVAYKRALLADPSLRQDFERLLVRTAEWRCERAAAASSGLVNEREGVGFRLQLKPSRGAEGQVYLLIEFIDEMSVSLPQCLVATGPHGECARLALPSFQGGTTQILSDEKTEIVSLLRNPKSEIFLW